MIGKAEWFGRRKYTGWGMSPRTWQGWAYVVGSILLVIGLPNILPIGGAAKLWITMVMAIILAADFVDIMIHLPKDERERLHEAVAERNALWAILLVLVAGIAYQAAQSVIVHGQLVDPVIITALLAGVLAKAATNWYLEKKD